MLVHDYSKQSRDLATYLSPRRLSKEPCLATVAERQSTCRGTTISARDQDQAGETVVPNESITSSSSSCDKAGGDDDDWEPLALELGGGAGPEESDDELGDADEASFKRGWGSSEMADCMVARADSSCAIFSLSSSTSAAALSLGSKRSASALSH